MRIGVVAAEAWRNVLTGASRTLTLLAATTVAFLGLAALDMSTVSRLDHDATAFWQGGAATVVLDAPGVVDGTACERLSQVTGVRAAGAVRQAPAELVPEVTPSNSIPLYLATPGFLRVVDAPTTGGISLAHSVAHQFGLARASMLQTTAGPIPVAGSYAYPDDGRLPRLQYAALAPASTSGQFDQCWAQVWPPDPTKWPLLYTALTATPIKDAPASISQLNARFGESLPEQHQFHARESRWAPLAAALLGAGMVLFVIRLRRLELSMARHLGVGRGALTLQLLLETLTWGGVVGAVTVASIDLYAHAGDVTRAAAAPFGVAVLTAGLAGCLVGALIGGLTCSQRQLFAHLKNRT